LGGGTEKEEMGVWGDGGEKRIACWRGQTERMGGNAERTEKQGKNFWGGIYKVFKMRKTSREYWGGLSSEKRDSRGGSQG